MNYKDRPVVTFLLSCALGAIVGFLMFLGV